MRVPAFVDHVPVGFVTVHGDGHAAAARGDLRVEAASICFSQESLEGVDIVERTGFRHVAAIQQGVDTNRLDALFPGANDHGLQMVDMAMHVAIGKETDEVNHPATGLRPRHDLLPGFALPDGAGGAGVGHQRSALAVDLTGADGVVADFGVAHVGVARHPDGRAVRLQGPRRALLPEPVQVRLLGQEHRVAAILGTPTDAIQDGQHLRPLQHRQLRVALERFDGHGKVLLVGGYIR